MQIGEELALSAENHRHAIQVLRLKIDQTLILFNGDGGEYQAKLVLADKRKSHVLIESFNRAGWKINKNRATMFVWAKIPDCVQYMGSLEFSKKLLVEAGVAVAPGIGFGDYGENYVRIALIENEKRIRQAAKNIKKFLSYYKKED